MKTLITLILIVLVAAGVYWFVNEGRHSEDLQQTGKDIGTSAEKMAESVKEKFGNLSFNTDDIKSELEKSGRVVRQKAKETGAAIADATADARTTATIKAKLVADPDLSALKISVNTTGGVVTLSGSVNSYADIAKAIELAMNVDGANEVISTLQVESKAR